MSEGQYDNNNRGACWDEVKTRSVTAEIDHRQFYGLISSTGADPNSTAPMANLVLWSKDDRSEAYRIAIFKKDGDGEKLAGGEFKLRSGQGFYVSVFRNKSDKPNSPARDLSFQVKEATQSQGRQPGDESANTAFQEAADDDIL